MLTAVLPRLLIKREKENIHTESFQSIAVGFYVQEKLAIKYGIQGEQHLYVESCEPVVLNYRHLPLLVKAISHPV